MKRSQLNSIIDNALEFMESMNFKLPPWAAWDPATWQRRVSDCEEIRRCALGWDLTDFGSGNFEKIGLLLFTIRNGVLADAGGKPYAEKIMIVQDGQVTPTHFHWRKNEDIINRGGGELVMTLNKAAAGDEGCLDTISFKVSIDGIPHACQPNETIRLKPGESVCLVPHVYHSFHAEGGSCLVGEVSSVNDDTKDNRFLEACARFPAIEEDVPARYLLGSEYPK